jgi:hypothetical protein
MQNPMSLVQLDFFRKSLTQINRKEKHDSHNYFEPDTVILPVPAHETYLYSLDLDKQTQ